MRRIGLRTRLALLALLALLPLFVLDMWAPGDAGGHAAFALIAAVALLAVWLLSARLVRPLREIAAVARAIGDGDMSRRADVRTGDELEALATSINDMAARLQETSGRLHAVLDAMTEAVFVVDPEGRVIDVNRAYRAITGLGREDLGKPLLAHTGRLDLRRLDGSAIAPGEMATTRALRGETVQGYEARIRTASGDERIVGISAAPLHDAQGRVLLAVGVARDITQQKRAEEEAVRRSREAEAARARLQEWTGAVAHDLRHPVGVIKLYAGLLAKQAGEYAPPSSTRVEHILASAAQIDRMVSDLLDFSSIEANALELRRERVDPAALVRAAAERIAGLLQGHPLRVEADGAAPPIEADPVRLEQVIVNLLSNAAKYGRAGTPIRLALDHGDGAIRISVTNEGEGVPPEDQPNLFQRFYRAPSAKDQQIPGLGLGLYITRTLVEAHGGGVACESTPGATTTFRVTLPIAAS